MTVSDFRHKFTVWPFNKISPGSTTISSNLVALKAEMLTRSDDPALDGILKGSLEWSVNVNDFGVGGGVNTAIASQYKAALILNAITVPLLYAFLILHIIRLTACDCWSPIKQMPFLEVLQKVRTKKKQRSQTIRDWLRTCCQKKQDISRVGVDSDEIEDDDAKKGLLIAQNDELNFEKNDIESQVISNDDRRKLSLFKQKLTEDMRAFDQEQMKINEEDEDNLLSSIKKKPLLSEDEDESANTIRVEKPGKDERSDNTEEMGCKLLFFLIFHSSSA